jgi:hypothetical protein
VRLEYLLSRVSKIGARHVTYDCKKKKHQKKVPAPKGAGPREIDEQEIASPVAQLVRALH